MIVSELLTHRTFRSICYLFQQVSLSSCLFNLQLAESYEIRSLWVIGIGKSHTCMLRIWGVALAVLCLKYKSVVVILILVPVPGGSIRIAVRHRKSLFQCLPLATSSRSLYRYGGGLWNLYSMCKLPADDSGAVRLHKYLYGIERRGHVTSTKATNPTWIRLKCFPCTTACSASSSLLLSSSSSQS